MIVIPCALSWRMVSNRRSDSCLLRADVGSSMMTSFALIDSACAMTTICCRAIDRDPARSVGRTSAFKRSNRICDRSLIFDQSIRPRRLGSGSPKKIFSAAVK